MSTQFITEQYEHWCTNQLIGGKPARPDTFVFAYIPGQDESTEIPCDEILLMNPRIRYRAPVVQCGLLVAERDPRFPSFWMVTVATRTTGSVC